MRAKCVVNLDDILTIPKSRLTERITTLSLEKMTVVGKAIILIRESKFKKPTLWVQHQIHGFPCLCERSEAILPLLMSLREV